MPNYRGKRFSPFSELRPKTIYSALGKKWVRDQVTQNMNYGGVRDTCFGFGSI